jgi:hypothetical protein
VDYHCHSVQPGIAKSHGKNRGLSFIEEGQTIQPQPVTPPITACVIPRYTAPMDFAPWRLTDDQQPSGARQPHHGAGPKGNSASQIRQARTSRNMRFNDIKKAFSDDSHDFPRSRPDFA